MDMYQKRKMRQENKNNNQESFPKVSINWYPGHMAKTRRLIKEKYGLIDIVYELIDARIPYSSKIKDIYDVIKDKPKIIIMTKKDLCDMKVTENWIKYYENLGAKVVLADLNNNNDFKKIISLTNEMMASIQEKRESKGLKEKEIRALVIGIPNVGKSTLINKMANRKVAEVGNNPGVTKNVKWLKTPYNILLLDTPGILWPKLSDGKVALNLAAMTSIKEEILPIDDVAVYILQTLAEYYPEILKERYGLTNASNIEEAYEIIAKNMGATKQGEVDYDRVSKKIVNDIKLEHIKGVTFDR
jgi:ribosome biogenesis GTPase A